jgi:hypothetical protein
VSLIPDEPHTDGIFAKDGLKIVTGDEDFDKLVKEIRKHKISISQN